MHSELETLDLAQLLDRLEDLEGRRTPVGWNPEDAGERSAVERRILELVSAPKVADERRRRLRVPCSVAIKVRSHERSMRAQTRDLGEGGLFIKTTTTLPRGTAVEIEIRGAGTEEHGLRVRGEVAWLPQPGEEAGLGVAFAHGSEAHERRLRRFVLELLRHRLWSA